MKIKRLVIEHFKSIERIELVEPNPFTVFVGPNGSGKSNIFEALEFAVSCAKYSINEAIRLFGGQNYVLNRRFPLGTYLLFRLEYEPPNEPYSLKVNFHPKLSPWGESTILSNKYNESESIPQNQFISKLRRLFVNDRKQIALNYQDDVALNVNASNLEKVLKRILSNQTIQEEIYEWLDLFIPGFKAVEIDDRNELHWFEESTKDYFTKDLISDGTYNILAMLTAVYQSEEPQFLCIEEPENGLHPEVIMSLVEFFRKQCEEKGHYIWLNTHSTSVVSKLRTDEIVLVEKKEGATRVKQVGNRNLYDLEVDYAWLSGALGGGLPW